MVTEIGTDVGALIFLFAVGDDGEWQRLLESDPAIPLVPKPKTELEAVERVELVRGELEPAG